MSKDEEYLIARHQSIREVVNALGGLSVEDARKVLEEAGEVVAREAKVPDLTGKDIYIEPLM
jgi:ribosomal protein L22